MFVVMIGISAKSQTSKNDTLVNLDNFSNKTEFTLEEILNAKTLVTNLADLTIISFQTSFSINGIVVDRLIKSNLITDELKIEIKKLSAGKKIYFEDIIAKNKEGKEIKLKPLVIKIK